MADTFRVRGVVLPEGEHRDLYVTGGRVTYDPVPDAELVAEGWVVPGLVDAHCHVGLDRQGAVDEPTQERQAVDDRDAGVLLIRDCGTAADTRWIDQREDLPEIVRAGRHLARPKRYIRNYAHEIEPEDLPAYVRQEAARGDGWVKLVGDWIDRDSGELRPCWPADILQAGIEVAHAVGARVTAHVFGHEALPDLLHAGIDCIEHGTGLTPDLVEFMSANQVALVPTVRQLQNFPEYAEAGQARYPGYAETMRDLHRRRRETIGAAHEAGVPIYAGTDAGGVLPHGLIAEEVTELVTYGLSPQEALAAASWRARAWLGREATLHEGARADLVVYPANPLDDIGVVADPARIVLRGRIVA